MSVGGKVVGIKEVSDLHKLADGLAVIAGHARGKILGRLDSTRGRLNRQPGNRNGRTGAAGIGVQDFVVDHDALGGIGS